MIHLPPSRRGPTARVTKTAAAAATLAAAVLLVLAGCTSSGSRSPGSTSGGPSQASTTGPVKGVTVGSLSPTYAAGGVAYYSAPVTATNEASQAMGYRVVVGLDSRAGAKEEKLSTPQVDEVWVSIPSVAPGEHGQQKATFDHLPLSWLGDGGTLPSDATVTLLRVDRFPASSPPQAPAATSPRAEVTVGGQLHPDTGGGPATSYDVPVTVTNDSSTPRRYSVRVGLIVGHGPGAQSIPPLSEGPGLVRPGKTAHMKSTFPAGLIATTGADPSDVTVVLRQVERAPFPGD